MCSFVVSVLIGVRFSIVGGYFFLVTLQEQQSATTSAGTVNPDWSGFQVCKSLMLLFSLLW